MQLDLRGDGVVVNLELLRDLQEVLKKHGADLWVTGNDDIVLSSPGAPDVYLRGCADPETLEEIIRDLEPLEGLGAP